MSPNAPNSGDSNAHLAHNNDDPRCVDCGHERIKCNVCWPRSTNIRDRKKRREIAKLQDRVWYCCKCACFNKFAPYDDPNHEDELPPNDDNGTESDASAQLRSYFLSAPKAGHEFSYPKLCGVVSPFGLRHDDNNFGASGPVLIILSCRVRQSSVDNTVTALETHVRQVFSIVQRLISLLSDEKPIDASILRTVLRTLFNQLANLTHRAFRQLAPGQVPLSNTHHHMLQVARNQAQRSYRSLWAHAMRAGFLHSSDPHLGGPRGLQLRGAEIRRSLVRCGQQAAVRELLLRARELAARLRFWRAMLMAGRSM